MKYGGWGKPQVTLRSVAIKTGKKQSERKKDLKKLKKAFPHLTLLEIERVYNENNENLENSLLNLSSFEVPQSVFGSANEKIELLEEMFEGIENSFIREVYGQCDNDISQATAFILEASTEDLEDSSLEGEFGNKSIGYVNKNALKRRTDQTFQEMLVESFPFIDRSLVEEVYESCSNDMINAFEILMSFPKAEERTKEEKKNPGNIYEKEYPSLQGVPQTKAIRQGVWAKDANNYFLDGNNLESVKKLKILMNTFPAIDDVVVKEIFFQMGDDLVASIQKLKELFPHNYREVPVEKPVYIPHPVTVAKPSAVETEEFWQSEKPTQGINDGKYNELLEVMQRSRFLHDKLFQAASNAAASGNFVEARRMTNEGKKHFNIYKDAYLKTYKETFRRNNEKFGPEVIDLHGLQGEEALVFLERYLKQAKNGIRRVQVITVKVM